MTGVPSFRLFMGLVLLFVLSDALEAGTVQMTVLAQDQRALGGALVHLEAGAFSAEKTTSGSGGVLFLAVPRGSMELRIEIRGFKTLAASVEVSDDEGVLLQAILAASSDSGDGQLRLLLREDGVGASTFNTEALTQLPLGGSPSSLLETSAPTTITDRIDGGGLYTGESARVASHGSSYTQTSYQLSHQEVSDPLGTGSPLLEVEVAPFDQVEVKAAALTADEHGPGPVVRFEPRSPGDSWHGALEMGLSTPSLASAAEQGAPRPIAELASLDEEHVLVSGPIAGERLSLLSAAGFTRSEGLFMTNPAKEEGRLASVLAELVGRPDVTDVIRVLGGGESASVPFPGAPLLAPGDARERDSFVQLEGSWDRRTSRGADLRLEGGYASGVFSPQVSSSLDSLGVDSILDGPVEDLADLTTHRRSSRLDLAATFSEDVAAFHGGEVLFGVSFDRGTVSTSPSSGPAFVPELVDSIPARVWEYSYAQPGSAHVFEFAAYLSGTFLLGERLQARAGVRLDDARGSAEGTEGTISWATLSPRLFTRWAALSRERLSVFMGYARYQDRLPATDLEFGAPSAPHASVYLWQDKNHDSLFEPGELGPLVASVGPGGGVGSIDPRLRPPRTDEFVLGLESHLGSSVLLRLLGIYRRERDLVGVTNVGLPGTSYSTLLIKDPGVDYSGVTTSQLLSVYDQNPATFGLDHDLLTNPKGDDGLHEGLELTLSRRIGPFQGLFAATAHRSSAQGEARGFFANENDQGAPFELFDLKNVETNAYGRLFFDRAYTLKLSLTYAGPWGTDLGVVARYEDGQPFSRLVVVPDLNQGPSFVQAFPRGLSRFTYTETIDLRLGKAVRLGRARLGLSLEVFNLMNTANEVEEDVVSGPAFRSATAIQPPRVARLGASLSF